MIHFPKPSFVSPARARRLSLFALACFAAGLWLFAAQRHALGMTAAGLHPVLRGSLPSFVHTYVFVLLACLWLAHSWPQAWGLGLLFWAVDLGLELLQQGSLHQRWGTPERLRAGLVSSFDWLDVAALTLGLVAAWATLAWARGPGDPPTPNQRQTLAVGA